MAGKKLPKLRFKKPTRKEKTRLTQLEREAFREEEKLKAAGFKAWVIGVRYKDGSTEEIPIIAKTYQEALRKAKPKMNQCKEQIDEITIVDPSIGEVLHKLGAGARKAARKIAKGVKMLPAKVEKLGLKAARKLGRIWAQPEQMREAFAAAKAERPWLTEEQFAAETGITRLREAEVGVPQISAPGIQYPPSERELLSAETAETLRREAERREAREAAEVERIRRPRARLNGRGLRPFGISLREYQTSQPELEPKYEEAPAKIGKRRGAWKGRAHVTIVR
jgi:hypothetical protein